MMNWVWPLTVRLVFFARKYSRPIAEASDTTALMIGSSHSSGLR